PFCTVAIVDGHNDLSGCQQFYDSEWMKFLIEVKVGTFNRTGAYSQVDWPFFGVCCGPVFEHSTVRIWAGRQGQPFKLVHNLEDFSIPTEYDPNSGRYSRIGKIWLTPYITGKNAGRDHPTFYTWYKDLIIKKGFDIQPIPDVAPESEGTITITTAATLPVGTV